MVLGVFGQIDNIINKKRAKKHMAEGASPSVIPVPNRLIRPVRPTLRGLGRRKRDDLRPRLVQILEGASSQKAEQEIRKLVYLGRLEEIQGALKFAVEKKDSACIDLLLGSLSKALERYGGFGEGPENRRVSEPAKVRELGKIILAHLKNVSKQQASQIAAARISEAKHLERELPKREAPLGREEVRARVEVSIEIICAAHSQLEMEGRRGMAAERLLDNVGRLRNMGSCAKRIGDAVFERLIGLGTVENPQTGKKNIGEVPIGEGATLLIPAGI